MKSLPHENKGQMKAFTLPSGPKASYCDSPVAFGGGGLMIVVVADVVGPEEGCGGGGGGGGVGC